MQIFAKNQMLKHDTKLLETRMNITRIHNRYIENHKTMFSYMLNIVTNLLKKYNFCLLVGFFFNKFYNIY